MIKKIIFFCLSVLNLLAYKAVIVKPVADFMGDWISIFEKDSSFYFVQPYSPEVGFSCSRIYQGLFNEVVDVIEEKGDECKFHYTAVFYLKQGKPCDEFYTLKNNLRSVDDFQGDIFPVMPNYKTNQKFSNLDEIVLIESFATKLKDENVVFSPGTRFKIDVEFEGNVAFKAYCLNEVIYIPRELALQYVNPDISNEAKVADFIKLLQFWAHSSMYQEDRKQFVPYVFGGASGIGLPEKASFELMESNDIKYWSYPDYNPVVKSGFDCSALICRAAQAVGLPFYFRNTVAINSYLYSLKRHLRMPNSVDWDSCSKPCLIENGDIIYFKGHVLVVSNVEENKCIHACGYRIGYGRVVELELNKIFKDIHTFNDLKSAFFNRSGLNLLNKDGDIFSFVSEFNILKLRSIFKG